MTASASSSASSNPPSETSIPSTPRCARSFQSAPPARNSRVIKFRGAARVRPNTRWRPSREGSGSIRGSEGQHVGSTRRAIPNVRYPATDTEGLVKNTEHPTPCAAVVLFQASQNLSPYFGSAASIAGLALLQSAVGVVSSLRHGVVMPRTSCPHPSSRSNGWPVRAVPHVRLGAT